MNQYATIMYHGICETSSRFDISKENFLSQLEFIRFNGYKANSIETVEKHSLGNLCCITFDDGRKSDLWAAETLAEFGFNATFFMVKDFLDTDSSRYISNNELKRISELGHSIGVHGKSHDWWTSIPLNKLIEDMKETKYFLEDLIGKEVVSCSAPGGKLNNSVIKTIKDLGYFSYLRNSIPKLNDSNNNFIVNAFGIEKDCSISSFQKIIEGDFLYMQYLLGMYQSKKIIKDILNK